MKSKLLKFTFVSQHSIQAIKRIVIFALCFGGLKLNAFSAMLLLSNLTLNVAAFGKIEFSLSLGIILTVLLNLGLQAAIPFFLLKKKEEKMLSVFYLHGLILIGLLLIFTMLYYVWAQKLFSLLLMALSFAVIFSLQILSSTIAKTKGETFKAIFLEGLFFLLLNGYNLYLFIKVQPASLNIIQALLWLQLGFFAIHFGIKLIKLRTYLSFEMYAKALEFGKPIILGSALIMLATGSGRIFIKYFFNLETVALYAICFRLTALMVLLHQIVNITFFKKLYASATNELDQWFEKILIVVAIVGAVLFYTLPYLGENLFTSIIKKNTPTRLIFLALCFQMFFWIALALFENIIAREELTKIFNKYLSLILVLMLTVMGALFLLGVLKIELFVLINAIAIYFAVECQIYLLNNIKRTFPNTKKIVRMLSLLLIISLSYILIIS